MKNKLNLPELESKKVFAYFEELAAIPHGSRNTRQISDYLISFAKEHGLECYQDEANNVVIIQEASAGYESADPIIMQGHMDMVCEKEKGVEIDFEKDGLELYVDGDFLKAKEFQQKRDDPDFVKSQRDDLLSMETGILNNKGRVHFTLTSPINDQLAKLDPNMEKNELIAAIASIIDKEIYKHYRFYPCNYVAYDLLTGTRRFSEHYGLKDKKQFEDYLQGQLDKIVLPNKDEAFLRTKILEMYTNPLKNFLANQE